MQGFFETCVIPKTNLIALKQYMPPIPPPPNFLHVHSFLLLIIAKKIVFIINLHMLESINIGWYRTYLEGFALPSNVTLCCT